MNVKFSALFDDGKNSSDNKGESTYLQCIINNLHINIGKIVFIFDDCISDPKHPFTFGATLNKLFIESTSEDFSDKRVDDSSSPFKYKKLSIESLNLFLDKIKYENIEKDKDTGDVSAKHPIKKDIINSLTDKDKEYLKDSLDFYLYCESEITDYIKDENYHNYLLRDLNIVIKLTINEKYEENKQPQINVFMETSTILTQITNKQLKSITDCTNYISLKDFYQQVTIDNHYKKKESIDNDTIKKYLDNYSLYYKNKFIDVYKNEEEKKIYQEKMEELEKTLKIESIIAIREMGNSEIQNIIEIGKIDKEIADKKNSWSNYFSSKNANDIEKLKLERKKKN